MIDIITWISHVFAGKNIILRTSYFFYLMKTGYSLKDFDVIFPIKSSEFIKSLNFGGNSKKNEKYESFFDLKIEFYR